MILSDQLPAHAGKKALLKLYAQPSRDREVVLANIGTLDHAHVPRILEHGSAGQYQYELLEWVEGETLTDFVGRSTTQRLAEDTVAAVVREIAQALQAMHSHSPPLTHGDIKPENVLIDHAGTAKIVDFGLGLYTIQSIPRLDFPAIAGVTLLLGAGYVIINAIVDILQVVADPRLRT